MLGAIIGDLAAWTYEHNRDVFYSDLVADNAELSAYGREVLEAARCFLMNGAPAYDRQLEGEMIQRSGGYLMWEIVCTWTKYLSGDHHNYAGTCFPMFGCFEKADGYTELFLKRIIKTLHDGGTKYDAYLSNWHFERFIKSFPWKISLSDNNGNNTILNYLFRAWDSFEKSWDFTSAIHNAMKWDGDRHLVAALTGTIAEAMYSCEYRLLKEKYGKNWYNRIEIPTAIEREDGDVIASIKEYKEKIRIFFPKNRALTNVERHTWTAFDSVYHDKVVTEGQMKKLLLSYDTGWEERYGLYLDDGWVYVYRSGCLIARFRFKPQGDGTYGLSDIQQGENPSDIDNALENILYVTLMRN